MANVFDTLPAEGQHDADDPAPLPLNGVVAGRYRLERLVGSGGMGHVYAVQDLMLDEPVALKILRSSTVASNESWMALLQELRTARKVSHVNVARVFDVGQDEQKRFLTMELIDGTSLAAHLRAHRRLPIAEVLHIGEGICAGLAAIHAAGIVHRDLKPDNVLIDGRSRVVISDFGIAAATSTSGSTALAGTPAYMAPEQVSSQPLDARADLYALGLILYEMLTGEPAWQADSWLRTATLRLDRPPPVVAALRPDAPRGLQALVQHCLAKDPQQRPASALLVLERLQRLAQQPTSPPRSATPRSLDALQLFMRARHNVATHWYGDAGEAVALLGEALAVMPDDPMLLSAQAMAKARLLAKPEALAEQMAQARATAERAVALGPDLGEPRVAVAVVAFSSQSMASAMQAACEALQLAPQLARAHEVIGRILLEIGPLADAETRLQLALAYDPANGDPQWELVRSLGLQQRWQAVTDMLALPAHTTADRDHREVHRARLSLWAGRSLAESRMPSDPSNLSPPLQYARIYDRALQTGQLDPADRAQLLAALGLTAPGSRLYTLFAQLACELLARDDLPTAFRVLADAVDAALYDLQWMDACPALAPMRSDLRFQRLRQRVDRRAARVRLVWDNFALLLGE